MGEKQTRNKPLVCFINKIVMKNFTEHLQLNEVFDISRAVVNHLNPNTNLLDYYRGEENFTINGKQKNIPFKEALFHTPIENTPKNKRNLWVHIVHYPSGYGNVTGAHLQVHFDMSHITPHDYLDSKKEYDTQYDNKKIEKPAEPALIYSHAFNKDTGLDPFTHGGGNAFSGLERESGSNMLSLFRKVVPHIVKVAWHMSKLHPNLPIAFNAGADDSRDANRKFMLYGKVVDEMRRENLIEPDPKIIKNDFRFEGSLPYFHVVKPIHR
jgi:hypothetical protein